MRNGLKAAFVVHFEHLRECLRGGEWETLGELYARAGFVRGAKGAINTKRVERVVVVGGDCRCFKTHRTFGRRAMSEDNPYSDWELTLRALPEAVLREALRAYFDEQGRAEGPVSVSEAIGGFLDNLGDSSKEDALDSVFNVLSEVSEQMVYVD